MSALFKDKELQSKFEKDGYLKLSLLNESEVAYLLNYYHAQEFDNKIEGGFYVSLDNDDASLVAKVGAEIKKIITPKSDAVLKETQIFTASYVVKEPGLQNIVPPHQDWTFVDEKEYSSATFWIPLVDVDENNGALGIIKGSHKLFHHYRCSPSPQSKSPLTDHLFTLFPYVEIIPMKAGEVLIFNNRLIHASPPNLSDEPRIAVGIGITQKEAQLVHYYQTPGTTPEQLELYHVSSEFFNQYNNVKLSDLYNTGKSLEKLNKINTVPREIPILTKEEMVAKIETLEGVTYNKPLMEKLARLFNYSLDEETQKTDTKPEIQTSVDTLSTADETQEIYMDKRTFFQKYTPANIIREIIWRLRGRPNQ